MGRHTAHAHDATAEKGDAAGGEKVFDAWRETACYVTSSIVTGSRSGYRVSAQKRDSRVSKPICYVPLSPQFMRHAKCQKLLQAGQFKFLRERKFLIHGASIRRNVVGRE